MDRDYVVERYRTRDGKVPFEEWVTKMQGKDPDVVLRILMRINRAIKRNFGDYRYLRKGVWEMRVDSGPGYRIYFAVENQQVYCYSSVVTKRAKKRISNLQ